MSIDPTHVLHLCTLIERSARDCREMLTVHEQLKAELADKPAGIIVPAGMNGDRATFQDPSAQKQQQAMATLHVGVQNVMALLNLCGMYPGAALPFLKGHGVMVKQEEPK